MKKILSTFLAMAMLLAMIPLTVNALVVDDWEVVISDGEAYLIGYTGTWPNKITLPTQVGNFKVRGILGLQFGNNVSEIIIPEGYISLKEIGVNSQYHSDKQRVFGLIKDNLRKITLPQSLEVLAVSFEGCTQLQEITIPEKVKTLTSIDCGYALDFDGLGMFENCTNLKYVYLHNGLEVIEANSFANCTALKDFKIPDTVTEIQFAAFKNCDSLIDMVIPDSVINYGNATTGTWATYTKVDSVFSDCDNLETVVIGNGVQKLHSWQEQSYCNAELIKCPKLKYVYLGNSITTLSGADGFLGLNFQVAYKFCGALGNSETLKTIIIPDGTEVIGQLFLSGSNNVECVLIPKSVTHIGPSDSKKNNFAFKNVDGKPLPKLFIYGYAGTTAEAFAHQEGFPFVDISVAAPTNSKVVIDGKEVAFTAYNIGGNNYFKLRDIASAINGTSKNFAVGWDGANNAISLYSKTSYNNVGGELVVNSNATATEPKISNPKIFVDGKLTTFMAFNIADNNYIKLRDLGEVFDFGVDWNNSTQVIEINTNNSYTK